MLPSHRPLRIIADSETERRGVGAYAARCSAAVGGRPGVVVLPSADAPRVAFAPQHRNVGRWLLRAFMDGRLPRWKAQLGSAFSFCDGASDTRPLRDVERVLGQPRGGIRLGYFSSSRGRNRVLHFLFGAYDHEPCAVLVAMADPGRHEELRREYRLLAELRAEMARTPVKDALPRAPLAEMELQNDFWVIEAFDGLGAAAGSVSAEVARSWLRDLHDATRFSRVFSDADVEQLEGWVRAYWPTKNRDLIATGVRTALRELVGSTVHECCVHGDYWRGNIASGAEGFRVFDWEWARRKGLPFIDLWALEIGDLTFRRRLKRLTQIDVMQSATTVSRELMIRGLDDRFALPSLVTSTAELAFRVRAHSGFPGVAEQRWATLFSVVEAVWLQQRQRI